MTEAQMEEILKVAHTSDEAEGIWVAATILAAVALRRMDSEFSRERKLRGVERELREDLAGIAKLEGGNRVA